MSIASACGIEAIVSAMRACPLYPDVQLQACLALRNLVLKRKNKGAIKAAGGIAAAKTAKKNHPNDTNVLNEAIHLVKKINGFF